MDLTLHKMLAFMSVLFTFIFSTCWAITGNEKTFAPPTVLSAFLLFLLLLTLKIDLNSQEQAVINPEVEHITLPGIHRYNFGECEFLGNKPDCSICLEEISKGCELMCKHYFHKECIAEWIKRSNSCPLCKREMTVQS